MSRGSSKAIVQYREHGFKTFNSSVKRFLRYIMSSFVTKVFANAIGFGIVWTGVLMFHVSLR